MAAVLVHRLAPDEDAPPTGAGQTPAADGSGQVGAIGSAVRAEPRHTVRFSRRPAMRAGMLRTSRQASMPLAAAWRASSRKPPGVPVVREDHITRTKPGPLGETIWGDTRDAPGGVAVIRRDVADVEAEGGAVRQDAVSRQEFQANG